MPPRFLLQGEEMNVVTAGAHERRGLELPFAAFSDPPDVSVVDARVSEALGQNAIDPGTAQRTRIIARLLAADRVSGQALAASLSVSRAAIHKHVEQLRDAGFAVRSLTGAGYELDLPADTILPEAVLPLLLGRPRQGHRVGQDPLGLPGIPYRYLPQTSSTNDVLRGYANEGTCSGTVCITDYQAAGRGRLERTWIAQPGRDLTFSLLVQPDLAPLMLRHFLFAAGMAVVDALADLPGLEDRLQLKWPNDVLLDGGKVAGILTETSVGMDSVHWMIIGVGLNVNSRHDAWASGATQTSAIAPISVRQAFGRPVSRSHLLVLLLERLAERFAQVVAGRHADVLADYRSVDALLARPVRVHYGANLRQAAVEGRAAGIGAQGELLVQTPDGALERVEFGEASLGPEAEHL